MNYSSTMKNLNSEHHSPAVRVRSACMKYTFKRKSIVILDQLNMTVPKGCIYGLLGASGCGKTTLLNCMMNFKKIDSGEILIFNGVPGTKLSGIPGPSVGYMPQELALDEDWSIKQALTYFGGITGMSSALITKKTCDLVKMLSLPNVNIRIKFLSGGQQRRVSLACTLIHQPKLLILDEPTVGLDPTLRSDIWNYLKQLSKNLITIIITTHYIEETRQADKVGFMRGGRILTEDSPNDIMTRLNEQSLERVFLKLSIMQMRGNEVNTCESSSFEDVTAQYDEIDIVRFPRLKYSENLKKLITDKQLKRSRVKALFWKHFAWLWLHYSNVVFFVSLVLFQSCFVCITLGHTPTEVSLSVYNGERINCKEIKIRVECNSTKLSCLHLNYIKDSGFKMIYYNSKAAAVQSVLSGKSYAAIIIQPDYSVSLRNRIKKWIYASSYDLKNSEISVIPDNTNAQMSTHISLNLYKICRNFLQQYSVSCKMNKRIFTYPLRMQVPIHGDINPNFTEYFLPGFMISLIMLSGIVITSTTVVAQRNIKDFERAEIVGMKMTEVMVTYFLTQFTLLFVVVLAVHILVFSLFNLTLKGSVVLLFLLSLHTGLCGMAYGVLIGSLCDSEFAATISAMGVAIILSLFSGMLWPFEGMHIILRWIACALPMYWSTEAFRDIMQKGWGWSELSVGKSFFALFGWTITCLLISIILTKYLKAK